MKKPDVAFVSCLLLAMAFLHRFLLVLCKFPLCRSPPGFVLAALSFNVSFACDKHMPSSALPLNGSLSPLSSVSSSLLTVLLARYPGGAATRSIRGLSETWSAARVRASSKSCTGV
jgi:hypothetical protein